MTTNYLKKFVILVAILMQMPTVNAQPEYAVPVNLHRKYTPVINGNLKPSKVPARQNVPVNLFYDPDNCTLFFESEETQMVTYYIYDECELLQDSGTYAGNSYEVMLEGLFSGQYTIVIEVDGIAYQGIFIVE